MLRTVFYAATYWAPAALILLIVIARVAAPFPYKGDDYNQTVGESLIATARELADKGNLYVQVDGGDPSSDILTDLNSRKLPTTFVPWSARSPAYDHCHRPSTLGVVVRGACMQDDFLSAELLAMPLWHVALVRVKTAACTAELTLVRGAQWHVLSQRAACT